VSENDPIAVQPFAQMMEETFSLWRNDMHSDLRYGSLTASGSQAVMDQFTSVFHHVLRIVDRFQESDEVGDLDLVGELRRALVV
jgi:hypothetical protein